MAHNLKYEFKGFLRLEGRELKILLYTEPTGLPEKQLLTLLTDNIRDNDDSLFFIDNNGQFYFIISKHFDILGFTEKTGFLIVDVTRYNEDYDIGFGIHTLNNLKCYISSDFPESQYRVLSDALLFTFIHRKLSLFYPGASTFKHIFAIGRHKCFALYDYVPKKRNVEQPVEQRMVTNLIFRFKEGKFPAMSAKLLALAAGQVENFIPDPGNTVVIPIPASTRQANEKRFKVFCAELASMLGVIDGYPIIELIADREPDAIKRGMPLSNVISMPDNEPIKDKDIIIVDDVLTRGEQFSQMADYLRSADVRSIVGLFLSKTVQSQPAQTAKLF